jgi:hypothetical protein
MPYRQLEGFTQAYTWNSVSRLFMVRRGFTRLLKDASMNRDVIKV